MKALLIVDVNDDSNLEPEADIIIDNGDFRLETKAFLKPMPNKKYSSINDTKARQDVTFQYFSGRNDLIDEILGG